VLNYPPGATVLVHGSMQQVAATKTGPDGAYTILNLFANGLPYTVTATSADLSQSQTVLAPRDVSPQTLNFGTVD
jgi:hypothetical protein